MRKCVSVFGESEKGSKKLKMSNANSVVGGGKCHFSDESRARQCAFMSVRSFLCKLVSYFARLDNQMNRPQK